MKKCPFCAEEIQDEAIKCRHCSEFLDKKSLSTHSQEEKGPWFYQGSRIAFLFCFIGPLILPLILTHPRWGSLFKLILTIIVCGVSFLMVKVFMISLESLRQYFELLQGIY